MSSPEKDYSFALKVYKDVKGREKKKKRIKEKKKKENEGLFFNATLQSSWNF